MKEIADISRLSFARAHRLSLAKPLRTLEEGSAERTGPATEEPRLFTRAVLVVEYEEGGELVRDITVAMDQINGRALKNVQGSLRAYRFTQEVGREKITASCSDGWGESKPTAAQFLQRKASVQLLIAPESLD